MVIMDCFLFMKNCRRKVKSFNIEHKTFKSMCMYFGKYKRFLLLEIMFIQSIYLSLPNFKYFIALL